MCHHDGRSSVAEFIQRLLQLCLGDIVESRGSLVQDEDLRILEEDARDGDALLLSSGQHHAPFADEGIVLFRQPLDEGVDLRLSCRFTDLIQRGVRCRITDILGDGTGKEEDILLHDADVLPQAVAGNGGDVTPADGDRSGIDVIEARNEVTKGGLTASGGTDQCYLLPVRDGEVQILQHLAAVASLIVERHMVKDDVSFEMIYRSCTLFLLLGRGVHDLAEALETGLPVLIHLNESHQFPNRRKEVGNKEEVGGEIPYGDPAFKIEDPSCAQNGEVKDVQHHLHAGVESRHSGECQFPGVPEILCPLRQFLHLAVDVVEGLGDPYASQGVLQLAVDLGDRGAASPVSLVHVRAKMHHVEDHEGEEGEDDEAQLPVDGEQDDEGTDQGSGGLDHVLRTVMGELGDVEQVVHDPGSKHTALVLVKKGIRQSEHVLKDVPLHIILDIHAHHMAVVGDPVVRAFLHQIDEEHDCY